MTARLSFTERYSEMLGIALLRHGLIGRQSYGSWEPRPEDYTSLGIKRDTGRYGMAEYASLETARCSVCRARMEVRDPREATDYRWAGTFADAESFEHAEGTLVCKTHPDKHPHYRVVLDGTLSDAIHYMNDIAEELGY